jgi:hypothetical protein
LIGEGVSLFTSNYVFAETYTALLVRVGRHEAIEWGRRFRAGNAIELVRVESTRVSISAASVFGQVRTATTRRSRRLP